MHYTQSHIHILLPDRGVWQVAVCTVVNCAAGTGSLIYFSPVHTRVIMKPHSFHRTQFSYLMSMTPIQLQ